MDVNDRGAFERKVSEFGAISGRSVTEEGPGGDRLALGLFVDRGKEPGVAFGASVASSVVVAVLADASQSTTAMAAARVLAAERGDALRAGLVATIPAGVPGSQSIRGSTGAFAIVSPSEVDLPKWVDHLAVHAPRPLCDWERATLDEVRGAVFDLVSRFALTKGQREKIAAQKKASASRTVVRRRK